MSKVDLVIRGGTVADGSGRPLQEADIAVSNGKIVAVGKVSATGRDELNAQGLLVTPGFIDLHTHYDGQLTWSENLDPSSANGVTTAVGGNCGVGFAPCRPEDREILVRLMEGVEDVPEAVMAEGLPWNWESFAEYLNEVERRPHDIDFALLLPHTPLRVFVMGKRAANLEPSTAADQALMRKLATAAMNAGACGFSTSRSLFHRASDGSHIPSLKAEESELLEIARGLADAGRGVLQAITMTGENNVAEYELLHRIALGSGRPLSYSLLQLHASKDMWRDVVAAVDRDSAAGADIRMQVFNRPVGMILGLDASFHPFSMHPYFVEHLADLPLAEQVQRMRDPQVRQILIQPAGELDHPLRHNLTRFEHMYPMGELADYEPEPSSSVAAIAAARGVSPYDVVYDVLLERDGHGMLLVTSTNYAEGNLDTTLELMRNDRAVVALGDGGAHYGMICDASYTTYTLTHWARDRRRERIDIAEAVRMLTDVPARLQRFSDRGRIAPGMKADLNVIDMDRLKLYSPAVVRDLPAGGRRLRQDVEGYVATYVSGVAIRREDKDTGLRPGRLVRDAGVSLLA